MTQTPVGPERDAEAPPPDDAPPPAPKASAPGESSSTDLVRSRHGLVPVEGAALVAQIEGNIKVRYFLARQNPRNWMDVRTQLLATMRRPIFAEGAIYQKPIGDGHAEGLSIRFAEEAFRVMGNVSVDTFLVSDDADKRVYQVTGTDLETLASIPMSVVVTKEIERRRLKPGAQLLRQRTNSKGQPVYVLRADAEDDYRPKEMAALQKARRDVILFLLPGDVKEECEQEIRKTLRDRDRKDPQAARNLVAEKFFGLGVTAAELEKFLGHPISAMNDAELHVLRAIYTAIKEGEGTWEQALAEKLGTNTGADEPTPTTKPAPAATGSTASRLTDAAKR